MRLLSNFKYFIRINLTNLTPLWSCVLLSRLNFLSIVSVINIFPFNKNENMWKMKQHFIFSYLHAFHRIDKMTNLKTAHMTCNAMNALPQMFSILCVRVIKAINCHGQQQNAYESICEPKCVINLVGLCECGSIRSIHYLSLMKMLSTV